MCFSESVIVSWTHEINFAFRRTKSASYAIHKTLIMRPSILTAISLKMWSPHLLQTALRFGGNLKMVCGWGGNKFVECGWSLGRVYGRLVVITRGSLVL